MVIFFIYDHFNGMINTTRKDERSIYFPQKNSTFFLVSLFITIAFLVFFGILLFNIDNNAETSSKRDTKALSEGIAKSIGFKLNGNKDYLELLSLERAEGRLSEKSFHTYVAGFLTSHPEFINITWIDSNFIIKTVYPLKGNSHIIGLPIELPEPKRASRLAQRKKQSIYTHPFEAIQSRPSIEIWVPVYKQDKFLGLFAGVYSCDKLLKESISLKTTKKTCIRLIDKDNRIVSEFPKHCTVINGTSYQVPINPPGNDIQLVANTSKEQPFTWITIILILLCSSLVISIAIFLWRVKRNSMRDTIFQAFFEQAAVGVVLAEPQTGRLIKANKTFRNILGYTEEEISKLTFQCITYEEDIPSSINNLESLRSGKINEFIMEKRYIRKDKSIIWANVTVSFMKRSSDYPHHCIKFPATYFG